ncbi:MAG: sigma-70 family RNA polymerase sigma factor [Aureispira sp.]|nr:sigma-70 family RNA polymerase sigma factor [Aureispira sp.]
MNTTELEEYRPLLFSIAYKMLGAIADAEDTVQDSFVKILGRDLRDVKNLKAYLVKVVTNLCIDRYNRLQKEREAYTGVWLPEPILTPERSITKEELSVGLLRTMELLTPIERAVFLLRDVFDFDYDLVADVVAKTETNCRKILSRAKQKLAIKGELIHPNRKIEERLIDQVLETMETGAYQNLFDILHQDIIAYTDGGGKAKSALKPILGIERVLKFYMGLLAKFGADNVYKKVWMNGYAGIAIYNKGVLDTITFYEWEDDKVKVIQQIRNPDKLNFYNQK